MLHRDKVAYEEWIIRHAENLVQERRNNIRLKCIEECYAQCDQSVPFENKNNYIESKIESTFHYFQNLDDMAHVGEDNPERIRK